MAPPRFLFIVPTIPQSEPENHLPSRVDAHVLCDVELGRLWNSVFLSVSREARNKTRLALPMEMKITLKPKKNKKEPYTA